MVDNLYQAVTPNSVTLSFVPFEVREYLERFCDENPDRAKIVWDTIGLAIQNAVNVANSNWLMNDEYTTYRDVIKQLVAKCVSEQGEC